jgi:hypothetical protein
VTPRPRSLVRFHHHHHPLRRALLTHCHTGAPAENTAFTASTPATPHRPASAIVTPHTRLEHAAKHHRQKQASPLPCRSRGTLAHRHGSKQLLAATQACSTAHPHQLWPGGSPQPAGRLSVQAPALTASLFTLAHIVKWHGTCCWPVRCPRTRTARVRRAPSYRTSLATYEDPYATPPR